MHNKTNNENLGLWLKMTCFILGYTGATGRALVKQLITDSYFQRIVLVGRRKCDLPEGADDRFVQEVVDYDNIGDYGHVFKDCKVGFCCLGSRDFTAGKEVFQKIDRDYVINTAAVAKDAGCEHFHVVTAVNTNIDSKVSYRKIKGEAEEGLKQLNFTHLTIYRPAYIKAQRQDAPCMFKFMEFIYKCVCFPCLFCCCSKTKLINVESIAAAMIYKTKNPPKDSVEVLENINIKENAIS